eukprot:GHUV01041025.1.p2 GENE.GHUV01041025.1~~GHUV01041025.1.p2  ORF type:complete len:186 (+),score=31.84 GHUV01041025.1:118-675(+)
MTLQSNLAFSMHTAGPKLAGKTADLCDKYIGDSASNVTEVKVLPSVFRCYGGNKTFHGPAYTVKCYECNTLVRKALEGPGEGRVLVVDGGASMKCALVGDALAELGVKNGWKGVVVNGPIRDSEAMSKMSLGVKALATHPLKSNKNAADQGQTQVEVDMQGVKVVPGDWVYADWDGILVSKKELA